MYVTIRAVDPLPPPVDAEATGEAIVARFNRFAREWADGEPERIQRSAEIAAMFDANRDKRCAEMWGCSINELPWNMRSRA